MKKITVLLAIVFFLLFAAQVFAGTSDNVTPTSSSSSIKPRTNVIRERIETRKENVQDRLEARKTKVAEKRENLFEKREDFKEKILLKREQASASAKLRRERFEKKLRFIKDERKKIIVERMNSRIQTANQKHTDRWADVLDKLQNILDRINQKAQNAKENGKDTSLLEAAIKDAQKAIDAAKTAVTTQAGKTYTLDFANETVLKTSVGSTISKFRQDLRTTHKAVVAARQAVHKAARELAKLVNARGVFNEENVEGSGKPEDDQSTGGAELL